MVDAAQAQESQLQHSKQLQAHYLSWQSRQYQNTITAILNKIDIFIDTFLFITKLRILINERNSIERLSDLEDDGIEGDFFCLADS